MARKKKNDTISQAWAVTYRSSDLRRPRKRVVEVLATSEDRAGEQVKASLADLGLACEIRSVTPL